MKTLLRTVLFLAVAAILSASVQGEDKHPVATNTPSTSAQTGAVALHGQGRQATTKFHLTKGLAVIHTTYHGPSNFIVGLLNSDGEHVVGLFNAIDNYESTHGFEIPRDGEYLLNVQAEGQWTFQIEQPRPESGDTAPHTFTGNRSDVSSFLSLHKGLSVFNFKYEGEGRFVATLVDRNGRSVEQLANALDAFQASAPVKIPQDGIYFLNITADGPWHIDLQ